MGGGIFEGLIVSEAYKLFAAAGKNPDIFFWRSNDGLEVDLIIRIENKLFPVEIKLTATPTSKHLEPLNKFAVLAGKDIVDKGIIVCRVEKTRPMPRGNVAMPWSAFPKWLKSVLEK
jgi:predicted AAA+ superfamily ATPase